jgi:catechol-2,3-dioxygenase
MFLVDSLQYITFHTPQMKQMYEYYVNILGLTPLEGSLDDLVYLAVHENKPALILKKAEQASVGEVGYNVRTAEAWAALGQGWSSSYVRL